MMAIVIKGKYVLISLNILFLTSNTSCHSNKYKEKNIQSSLAAIDPDIYILKRTRVAGGDSAELWINKQDTSDYIIRQYRGDNLMNYLEYKHNLKNGYALLCYDDGKKWREWHYKDDKLDGIFAVYDKQGRLTEGGIYRKDSLIHEKHYDPPLEPKNQE